MRRWSGERTAAGTLHETAELLEGLPVAAALLTPDGRLIRCNAQAVPLLDLETTDAPHAHATVDRALRRTRAALLAERSSRTVLSRRHEGRRIALEMHGRLQRDGSTLVLLTDCTDELRARRGQRRSEAMLRRVIARDTRERLHVRGELRRSEEQLRHAQKMDAVGRLAAGIAHDFNNVLTAIQGHVQFLLEDLPPDLRSRADITGIQRATESAARLTRQLLTFARRQPASPSAIDVDAVIGEVEQLLRRLIRADVRLDTSLEAGASVFVDPGQLEQVIVNLVVNARDALGEGGTITIVTTRVDFDASFAEPGITLESGEYVILSVSDDGCGMSEEVRRQAFEPFFTTRREGTGLGLPTAYGIVKQAGGHISIYSEPGVGTTVKVFLPVQAGSGLLADGSATHAADSATDAADSATDAADSAPRMIGASVAISASGNHAASKDLAASEHLTASPAGTDATSGVVLLVEDDDSVRSLARRTLEYAGFDVIEAADGQEALGAARAAGMAIDVLLTDLMMPRVGGEELSETVATLHPAIGIVVMSGFSEASLVREGRLRAGRHFLEKPFTPTALLRSVREAMRGR
jgi:two-component system, cell cycle sensor histidine kinase and response regulator CckA